LVKEGNNHNVGKTVRKKKANFLEWPWGAQLSTHHECPLISILLKEKERNLSHLEPLDFEESLFYNSLAHGLSNKARYLTNKKSEINTKNFGKEKNKVKNSSVSEEHS
jgi:hypothetical protein